MKNGTIQMDSYMCQVRILMEKKLNNYYLRTLFITLFILNKLMAQVKRTYYSSGKLLTECFELNGIKNGEWKEYHEN